MKFLVDVDNVLITSISKHSTLHDPEFKDPRIREIPPALVKEWEAASAALSETLERIDQHLVKTNQEELPHL